MRFTGYIIINIIYFISFSVKLLDFFNLAFYFLLNLSLEQLYNTIHFSLVQSLIVIIRVSTIFSI